MHCSWRWRKCSSWSTRRYERNPSFDWIGISSNPRFLQATKVYTEQLLELHRGQGMEIYWRDSFTCPSEADYKLMTVRKTGGLFMLAIRLMQLFSSNKEDYSKLTAILGLYFQIRDDYCNLSLKEVSGWVG